MLKAHPCELQLPPAAKFQYDVFGVGKVIPLLPPQSPQPVNNVPVAAPAMIISRKSKLYTVNEFTVHSLALKSPITRLF